MITIKPTERWHASAIAPFLRPADLEEVKYVGNGREPVDVLLESIERSHECYTVFVGVTPVGLFGLVHTHTGSCPWALGTPELTFNKKTFMRESKIGRAHV